jgi:sec-independent protein translocase protein TatB
MFGVDFSEFMVIGAVALIVIGPEKLPRVARTAGALLGRLQRHVAEVKADISREIQLEEMKRLQSEMLASARELEEKIQSQVREVEQNVQAQVREVEEGVQAQVREVEQAVQPQAAEANATGSSATQPDAAAETATEVSTPETSQLATIAPPADLAAAQIPPITQAPLPVEAATESSTEPAPEPVDDRQLDLFGSAADPRKS